MSDSLDEGITELDKLLRVRDHSKIVGEFLEYLEEHRIYLAKYEDGYEDDLAEYEDRCDGDGEILIRIHRSKESLIADFFGLDIEKIEEEKRSILRRIQREHEEREGDKR